MSNRIVLGTAITGFILALIGVVIYFNTASSAMDPNTQNALAGVPLVLWWAASFFLAVAFIYGILSTRSRSSSERRRTEAATKQNLRDAARDEGVSP